MLRQMELLPGVRLTTVRSTKFKTACFSINLLRPLRADEAARNALIPDLLLRGSDDYPDLPEISCFLEEAYGASVGTIARKKGEIQVIGLYADFLEDAIAGEPLLQRMARFVSGLLLTPVTEAGGFRSEAFAVERENLRNTMAAARNDKRVYAVRQLFRAMFRDEPYGTPSIGEEKDLEQLDPVGLYGHYRRILAESPIELFYMGAAEPETVARIFADTLQDLPRSRQIPLPPVVRRQPQSLQSVTETQNLAQSKLAMGFRMEIPESPEALAAAQLFLTVFGAGSNSKLFLHVREERSLCYYASASFDKYKGVMIVSSGIDADNYEEALSEIRRQLALCAAGEITDEELALARIQLLSQMRTMLDNPARLEEFYVGCAAAGRAESVEALLAALEHTDRTAVIQAAAAVREDTVFFLKGVEA